MAIVKRDTSAMVLAAEQQDNSSPTVGKEFFIALADAIRAYNVGAFPAGTNISSPIKFGPTQLCALADFLQTQNKLFKRERWLWYVQQNAVKVPRRKAGRA